MILDHEIVFVSQISNLVKHSPKNDLLVSSMETLIIALTTVETRSLQPFALAILLAFIHMTNFSARSSTTAAVASVAFAKDLSHSRLHTNTILGRTNTTHQRSIERLRGAIEYYGGHERSPE